MSGIPVFGSLVGLLSDTPGSFRRSASRRASRSNLRKAASVGESAAVCLQEEPLAKAEDASLDRIQTVHLPADGLLELDGLTTLTYFAVDVIPTRGTPWRVMRSKRDFDKLREALGRNSPAASRCPFPRNTWHLHVLDNWRIGLESWLQSQLTICNETPDSMSLLRHFLEKGSKEIPAYDSPALPSGQDIAKPGSQASKNAENNDASLRQRSNSYINARSNGAMTAARSAPMESTDLMGFPEEEN